MFREGNYELELGSIRLALTGANDVALTARVEPDEALLARQPNDLRPGDDAREHLPGVLGQAALDPPQPAASLEGG